MKSLQRGRLVTTHQDSVSRVSFSSCSHASGDALASFELETRKMTRSDTELGGREFTEGLYIPVRASLVFLFVTAAITANLALNTKKANIE